MKAVRREIYAPLVPLSESHLMESRDANGQWFREGIITKLPLDAVDLYVVETVEEGIEDQIAPFGASRQMPGGGFYDLTMWIGQRAVELAEVDVNIHQEVDRHA
jgi:hypothetical protein